MNLLTKLFPKSNSFLMLLLTLAILIGSIVRIWKITTLPFPPNGDELAFGYYGWSLLHFGTDEFGSFLPMNFPSIGDYKYPGLAYLNILPAAIFGLSEITARFWSVVSGIILIPLIYLLTKELFENSSLAIIAAYIMALSPWSLVLSRLGYENHPALTLSVAGFVCLLKLRKSQKKTKLLFLITTIILLVLSTFTYAAERMFIPLMLIALIVLSFLKNSRLAIIRKYIYILLIILGLTIMLSLIPWQNRGRAEAVIWKGVSITQMDRLHQLYIQAGTSPIKIPVWLTHVFHNKIRVSLEDFLYRYLNYFSPKFLFFEGEAAIERIPDTGMLPILFIIFLPFGLLTFLSFKNHSSLFVLAWLLFAPLPSALTFGEPHINRASLMIPPLTIITAFGFWQLLNFFSKRNKIICVSLFSILFFFNFFYILNQIFVQKPVDKPWFTEQVNKELVFEVFKLKNHYQTVVIPKDEYIYFLFYGKISPQDFLKNASIKPATRQNSWDRVERLENIYFNMAFDCPKGGKLDVLYICKGDNIPQNSQILKVIRYLDGVPAYTLLQFIPISKMPSTLPELPARLRYMVDIERSPQSVDGLIPRDSSKLW